MINKTTNPEKRAVKLNEGSAKARRTAARLAAVQVLYQMRLNNQDARSAVTEFVDHRVGFKIDGDILVPADVEMLEEIIQNIESRAQDIEMLISNASQGSEVEVLLEAILMAGACELLTRPDVDTGIIISDYMNVAKGFYDGNEPKLVNAVLDKIAKTVRD